MFRRRVFIVSSLLNCFSKMVHRIFVAGFWICLSLWICQGTKYTRVVNMPLVLNMPVLRIYQSSQYTRVLNMPLVLNSHAQDSEYGRVTQGSWYVWIWLNMSEYVPDVYTRHLFQTYTPDIYSRHLFQTLFQTYMSGYPGICVNIPKSA